MNKMRNWKTTVFGILAAVGYSLHGVPGTLGIIGNVITCFALGMHGIVAQDSVRMPPSPIISSKQK